jgi:hypothetical protein
MPLKFWDEAFLTATYLINMLPSKTIDNDTPMEHLLKKHLTMHLFMFLGAPAGPIFDHTTNTNLPTDQNNVYFLAIVTCTKGSNVLILNLVEFISLEMLSLMKVCFPSPNFIPMLVLFSAERFYSFRSIFKIHPFHLMRGKTL